MHGKFALLMVLTLISVGITSVASGVKRVEASGTIYIRADGSVEGTAYIVSNDNVTYVFAADINDSIVVERSNVIVDGKGHTLQGPGDSIPASLGMNLRAVSGVAVMNMRITAFDVGILLNSSVDNSMRGNNITANNVGISLTNYGGYNLISGNNIAGNNLYGILLNSSYDDSIRENNVTANSYGIYLSSLNGTVIAGNNIANNQFGIFLDYASYNIISPNNFLSNVHQAVITNHSSENIWDNGPPYKGNYWSDYNGTDANHDGIGDTPYIIDANNTDHYPLITLYIIPEFPLFLILPLFFIATLLAVIVYRGKHFYSTGR
jgi:parallel beta-helix repeat protein